MRLTTCTVSFVLLALITIKLSRYCTAIFSEKKAAAYLFKLKKQTIELAQLCRAITQLTEEFEVKHLKKGENDSKNWSSKYNWCTFL
jgi:hypothetical protein